MTNHHKYTALLAGLTVTCFGTALITLLAAL